MAMTMRLTIRVFDFSEGQKKALGVGSARESVQIVHQMRIRTYVETRMFTSAGHTNAGWKE